MIDHCNSKEHNLCKSVIFCDKDAVSHTKMWSNVGYFLMCLAFSVITTHMLLHHDPFPTDEWLNIFIAFGAMVAIPRGFAKWITYKTATILKTPVNLDEKENKDEK